MATSVSTRQRALEQCAQVITLGALLSAPGTSLRVAVVRADQEECGRQGAHWRQGVGERGAHLRRRCGLVRAGLKPCLAGEPFGCLRGICWAQLRLLVGRWYRDGVAPLSLPLEGPCSLVNKPISIKNQSVEWCGRSGKKPAVYSPSTSLGLEKQARA